MFSFLLTKSNEHIQIALPSEVFTLRNWGQQRLHLLSRRCGRLEESLDRVFGWVECLCLHRIPAWSAGSKIKRRSGAVVWRRTACFRWNIMNLSMTITCAGWDKSWTAIAWSLHSLILYSVRCWHLLEVPSICLAMDQRARCANNFLVDRPAASPPTSLRWIISIFGLHGSYSQNVVQALLRYEFTVCDQ